MAKYEDMRDGFDKDCKEMNMKSATVHSNAFGKTYTFRLKYGHHIKGSSDSNQPNTTEHKTFVMTERSEYQMNRNMIRANLGKYRYQGRKNYEYIEDPRNCNSSAVSETNLGHLDISPVSQHSQTLPSSQLNGDSFVNSCSDSDTSSSTTTEGLYDIPNPPESDAAKPPRPICYAESNHLPTEKFQDGSMLILLPPTEQLICHESVVIDTPLSRALSSQISTISPVENIPLKELSGPTTRTDSVDDIELDYTLPRDQCSNASENDLLCSVCSALPPYGSKLHFCVNCSDILCGYCELLPSNCHHVMAGSKPHTLDVVKHKPTNPVKLLKKIPTPNKQKSRQLTHEQRTKRFMPTFCQPGRTKRVVIDKSQPWFKDLKRAARKPPDP